MAVEQLWMWPRAGHLCDCAILAHAVGAPSGPSINACQEARQCGQGVRHGSAEGCTCPQSPAPKVLPCTSAPVAQPTLATVKIRGADWQHVHPPVPWLNHRVPWACDDANVALCRPRQDQDWEGESPDVSGDEGTAGRRRGAAGGWPELCFACVNCNQWAKCVMRSGSAASEALGMCVLCRGCALCLCQ